MMSPMEIKDLLERTKPRHEHSWNKVSERNIAPDKSLANDLYDQVVHPMFVVNSNQIDPDAFRYEAGMIYPVTGEPECIYRVPAPVDEYRKAAYGYTEAIFLCDCGDEKRVSMIGAPVESPCIEQDTAGCCVHLDWTGHDMAAAHHPECPSLFISAEPSISDRATATYPLWYY